MHPMLAESIGGMLVHAGSMLAGLAASVMALFGLRPAARGDRSSTLKLIVPAVILGLVNLCGWVSGLIEILSDAHYEMIFSYYCQWFGFMAAPFVFSLLPIIVLRCSMHPISLTKANRCRQVGVVLSLVPWFIFVATVALGCIEESVAGWHYDLSDYFWEASSFSCLICSSTALVLFIISFRDTPASRRKILYILLSGVPLLFGLFVMALLFVATLLPVR